MWSRRPARSRARSPTSSTRVAAASRTSWTSRTADMVCPLGSVLVGEGGGVALQSGNGLVQRSGGRDARRRGEADEFGGGGGAVDQHPDDVGELGLDLRDLPGEGLCLVDDLGRLCANLRKI